MYVIKWLAENRLVRKGNRPKLCVLWLFPPAFVVWIAEVRKNQISWPHLEKKT